MAHCGGQRWVFLNQTSGKVCCAAGKEVYLIMRIAQVAPLYESVPPKLYGGTERVVSHLTEELVRAGHDVTLFASGDSLTQARLVPACKQSLRLAPDCVDPLAHHLLLVERVLEEIDNFDLIHFHIDYLHFPRTQQRQVPTLTTLHGRLDIPDLVPIYQKFRDMPVISISDSQRKPLPWLNWKGTVYHGIPIDSLRYQHSAGKYLAFLGRTSPEKGLDQAIRIAQLAGVDLKIAAKIDRADQAYFEAVIKPLLKNPGIEFVGEIGHAEKGDFLGGAIALLCPLQWPEPFGLVMIEAMACGTPVIAYPRGSVPELVEHGVSGFIVGDEREAAHAVVAASALSRSRCRHYFERRFSAARMCADYLAKYEDVLFPEPVLSTAGLSSSQPMAGNRIPSLFRQDFDLDEV
jgi:glycosyltransferase involved in cell wall biosynthesis